ncbi:hypothetical protein AAE478_007800 [Parahypoxylon ruwenzoriense]
MSELAGMVPPASQGHQYQNLGSCNIFVPSTNGSVLPISVQDEAICNQYEAASHDFCQLDASFRASHDNLCAAPAPAPAPAVTTALAVDSSASNSTADGDKKTNKSEPLFSPIVEGLFLLLWVLIIAGLLGMVYKSFRW